MQRPDILALLETHLSGRRAYEVCTQTGFHQWYRVEARGFSGGIWVLWNPHEIGLRVLLAHDQFITMEVHKGSARPWLYTVVYASPHAHLREELWCRLQQAAQGTQDLWLLAGDFNETINLEERNHGGPDEGAVRHLAQSASDHSPLLINSRGFSTIPLAAKPFRFQDLGKYLGVPTINGKVTKETFREVVQRVDKRLSGWKTKCLSLAGRLTLIHSTLSSLPSFIMQMTWLPRSICDELDRKTRRFLWGGTAMERKTHLVAWNVITLQKDNGGLGIRPMRCLNSALMLKLGWRLHAEPSSLRARVLRHKYCNGMDTLPSACRKNSSNVWKGIMAHKNDLQHTVGLAIGNGNATHFWTNTWAIEKPLVGVATTRIPIGDLTKKVSEYWDRDHGWNWAALRNCIPQGALDKIASFELLPDNTPDNVFWHGETSGRFSVKSAMSFLQQERRPRPLESWKWVWKLKVPLRVSMFVWLPLHNKLMTNVNRARRHLTLDTRCTACGFEVEDLDHILRKCPQAVMVWRSLAHKGWGCVAHNAERCATSIDPSNNIPRDKGEFLIQKFCEVNIALHNSRDTTVKTISSPTNERITWQAPPMGWVTVNTDGASKGNPGHAGGGGVIRGDRREWLVGFIERMGVCSSTKAEIKATLQGLRLAQHMGLKKISLQLDSLTVMGMLKGTYDWCLEHAPLLSECKSLIESRDWEVKVSHCFREANQVADHLANLSLTMPSTYYELSAPPPEDWQKKSFKRIQRHNTTELL
ncbi:hypothetical protein Cgig2_012263 [Carnegiea gigantea]|uniref:RNase H type-1 domain-containing protein n=1 Tax=Carnegiea gigantea TaxID=171969 RepID=A0A9Q1K482_9CARY|nr:hypothetical protein Cgig2_012263 [Carnegiea gigantea]